MKFLDKVQKGLEGSTEPENHLVVKVLKQKPGLPSGRVWLCKIDFDRNLIVPEEEYL